jgi:hypothetical protein
MRRVCATILVVEECVVDIEDQELLALPAGIHHLHLVLPHLPAIE